MNSQCIHINYFKYTLGAKINVISKVDMASFNTVILCVQKAMSKINRSESHIQKVH